MIELFRYTVLEPSWSLITRHVVSIHPRSSCSLKLGYDLVDPDSQICVMAVPGQQRGFCYVRYIVSNFIPHSSLSGAYSLMTEVRWCASPRTNGNSLVSWAISRILHVELDLQLSSPICRDSDIGWNSSWVCLNFTAWKIFFGDLILLDNFSNDDNINSSEFSMFRLRDDAISLSNSGKRIGVNNKKKWVQCLLRSRHLLFRWRESLWVWTRFRRHRGLVEAPPGSCLQWYYIVWHLHYKIRCD